MKEKLKIRNLKAKLKKLKASYFSCFILIFIILSSGCISGKVMDPTKTVKEGISSSYNKTVEYITPVEEGVVNHSVIADNLKITVYDYRLYSKNISQLDGNALWLNFKVTNIGDKIEAVPTRFALVRSDGHQIEPTGASLLKQLKTITRKIPVSPNFDVPPEIYPEASTEFWKVFVSSEDFDLKNTKIKIETNKGNVVELIF